MLQKMDKLEDASSVLLNEQEYPIVEESHRFVDAPALCVLGTISLVHECNSVCKVLESTKRMRKSDYKS